MAGASFNPGVYYAPSFPSASPAPTSIPQYPFAVSSQQAISAPPETQYPFAVPMQSSTLADSTIQYPLAVSPQTHYLDPSPSPSFAVTVLDDADQQTVYNLAWELFFTSPDWHSKLTDYFQHTLNRHDILQERIYSLSKTGYKIIICWDCTKKMGGTSWLMKNRTEPTPLTCFHYAHSISELFWHRLFRFLPIYGRKICPFKSFDKCAQSGQRFAGWECIYGHENTFTISRSFDRHFVHCQEGQVEISFLFNFKTRQSIEDQWRKSIKSHNFPFYAEHFFAKNYSPLEHVAKDFKLKFCAFTLQNIPCHKGKLCDDAHLPIQFFLHHMTASPSYKTKRCELFHQGIHAITCSDVHPGEPTRVAAASSRKMRLQWPNGDYYEFEFHVGKCNVIAETICDGKKKILWENGNSCDFTFSPRHYEVMKSSGRDEKKQA